MVNSLRRSHSLAVRACTDTEQQHALPPVAVGVAAWLTLQHDAAVVWLICCTSPAETWEGVSDPRCYCALY